MQWHEVQHYLLEVYEHIQVGGFVRFADVLHKAQVFMSGIIFEIPPCDGVILGRTLNVHKRDLYFVTYISMLKAGM